MNRRQRIIVSITGITLVLLILLGLTYGYFLTRIQGNSNAKSISVTTADLLLVYGDGTGNIINGENITPGTTIGTKDFTVTNEGDSETEYVVVLDNVRITTKEGSTTTFNSNDFVYELTCSGKITNECNGTQGESVLPLSNDGILIGNKIAKDEVQTYNLTVKYKETGIDQSLDMGKKLEARVNIKNIKDINPYASDTSSLAYNIINNAKLKKDGTDLKAVPERVPAKELFTKYSKVGKEADDSSIFYAWSDSQERYWTYGTGYEIDENTGLFNLTGVNNCKYSESSCNQNLVGKYFTSNEGWIVWNEYGESTTSGLSSVYKVVSAPPSSSAYSIEIEVKEISAVPSKFEGELSVTPDDYGTSYYYRGMPEDNYVNFANMCWRIVRIEGDGSVKLILEDQNELCSSTMDGNWDIPTTKGGSTKTGNYGYDDTDKLNNSSDKMLKASYLKPVTKADESQVYAYYNFQNSLGEEILSKLKKENWCLGDLEHGYSYNSPYDLLTDSASTLQYNKISFYYEDGRRMEGKGVDPYATLVCNGTKINEFVDVTYSGSKIVNHGDMKVATLTADEMAFAGAKYKRSLPYIKYFYLYDDNYDYWLLSSCDTTYGYNRASFTGSKGAGLSAANVTNGGASFRPSIVLLPNTTISSGNGTIENPYKVD